MGEPDIEEIYGARLLALAEEGARVPRLAAPDVTVEADSPLCGSRIAVDLRFDGERIAAWGQEIRACALGRASAAVVARLAPGRSFAELMEVRARLRAMLERGGPPPQGEWAELALLEPVRMLRSRHGSIMLPFEALARAIGERR